MTTAVFELLRDAVRDRFGGNITRLATACDTSVQLASRWVAEDERRRINPSPASCEKIAQGLDLDPDYILEMAGHRRPRPDRPPLNARLASFLAQVEAGWLAMDSDDARQVAERGTLAMFVAPAFERTANARAADSANGVERRRRELLTGVDQQDPMPGKRRKFAIRSLSTHAEHVVKAHLAALWPAHEPEWATA